MKAGFFPGRDQLAVCLPDLRHRGPDRLGVPAAVHEVAQDSRVFRFFLLAGLFPAQPDFSNPA